MLFILGFIACAIVIFFAGKKLSYYGDLLAVTRRLTITPNFNSINHFNVSHSRNWTQLSRQRKKVLSRLGCCADFYCLYH